MRATMSLWAALDRNTQPMTRRHTVSTLVDELEEANHGTAAAPVGSDEWHTLVDRVTREAAATITRLEGEAVAYQNTIDGLEFLNKQLQMERDEAFQSWNAQVRFLTTRAEAAEAALKYEQHREGRIGTHGPNCHTWGPQHYECLLARFEALTGDLTNG